MRIDYLTKNQAINLGAFCAFLENASASTQEVNGNHQKFDNPTFYKIAELVLEYP